MHDWYSFQSVNQFYISFIPGLLADPLMYDSEPPGWTACYWSHLYLDQGAVFIHIPKPYLCPILQYEGLQGAVGIRTGCQRSITYLQSSLTSLLSSSISSSSSLSSITSSVTSSSSEAGTVTMGVSPLIRGVRSAGSTSSSSSSTSLM